MGRGKPAVLIHGWRLTGDMFEFQTLAMLETGYRVITYDRRGFGQSEHAASGYDYNTFADDLASVIGELALENVALLGFSMGSGEITRYLTRHGPGRIAKAALVSSIVPHLLKGDDNPEGVDESVFDTIRAQAREDRCLPPGFCQAVLRRRAHFQQGQPAPARLQFSAWRDVQPEGHRRMH
jgi:non-heme chloroperoxidase